MFINGKIENWVIFLDSYGVGLTNVPVKVNKIILKTVIKLV